MRVYLEIVEERAEEYGVSPLPSVRIDVTGLDRETIVEVARHLADYFIEPRVRIHRCMHEEGGLCIVEDITGEVLGAGR